MARMLSKSVLCLVSPYLRQLLELLRAEAIKLRGERHGRVRTQEAGFKKVSLVDQTFKLIRSKYRGISINDCNNVD